MRQESFERKHQETWDAVQADLQRLERGRGRDGDPGFAERYRRLCQQLSLARYRGYGAHLEGKLNALAVRGHHQLYTRRDGLGAGLARLVTEGFPRAFRQEWRLVLLAHLLFYGPFFGMILAIAWRPELVYSVVDPGSVSEMEAMYDPDAARFLKERDSDSDVLMFGFYIRNNIGIAFRTFASGVLGGAGSIFFLVYNGFFIGAVAGHLTQVGHVETFWSFVVTHGAFELTAIVLSGAAGLRLGLGLLAPGRKSRSRALAEAGKRTLPMLFGLTCFLVIAAFIEAFWSSMTALPPQAKYASGAVCWTLVYGYLLLAGRSRGA